ncbi:iron-sulfur cluster assembly scaffold protein [Candidatus Woesearchaeota archaeon]|nr:iron-sulfur cluster assembly scaffold protein [Candidatus Woesearchaeota archaeon]
MSFQYSDEILRRFRNPKNAGEIKNPDGIGMVGNRSCGDVMHLYIKVENNKIVDAKFKTLGCAAAISFSDLLCDMVKNQNIEDALKLTKDDLVKKLGGVPAPKLHCSLLAVDALHKAIEDFKNKK